MRQGGVQRAEIVLIGPIGAGKSTLGRLVAQRLGLPQVAMDVVRWGYYEQIGYDQDHAAARSKAHGFEGLYRYWKRFELYAVERLLAEHAGCVMDFGGGHSVYEDDVLFERARRALAPFRNVVLVLPSPDLDESVRLLRERTGMRPAAEGRLDFAEHFVRHHSNHDLATVTIYTHGKSPEETAEELLIRVTWAPAWRVPPERRRATRSAERATTLLHAAVHASERHGEHETAGRYLDEALAIRRELGGDATGLAEVLGAQAMLDLARGRPDDARRRLTEALGHYEAAPRHAPPEPVRDLSAPPATPPRNRWPTGYARILEALGRIDRNAGDCDAARGWYERAVQEWRPFGRANTARLLRSLSEVAREQGDLARADQAYDEALAIDRTLEDAREIANTLCMMAGPEEPRVERVVYELPGTDDVAVRRDIPYAPGSGAEDLLLDLYLPPGLAPGERRPAVLFVHGGAARTRPIRAKEHGVFQGWGRLAAAVGLAGVTFNHRRPGSDLTALDEAAGDVDRLVDYVRANAAELRIDGERLALFAFSSAPPAALRTALRDRPEHIRCLVVYNGIMDPRPYRHEIPQTVSDAQLGAYSPTVLVAAAGGSEGRALPPMFLARAGHDDVALLNETVDRFAAAALAANAPLTLVNHPTGRHAFSTLDPGPRSREIIRDTLTFLTTHLLPSGS